jgi:hypothetical protein
MAKINVPLIAAVGAGGYFLWKWDKDKKAADASILPDVGPVLPPNTQILPGVGPVLVPPVSVGPQQTYTPAVQTPYGAVIPSFQQTQQPTTTTPPPTQATQSAAITARMQEMLYRHQYIYNSIAYGLNWGLTPSGQADKAGLDARIATLRAKDAVLQAEWASYTGGQSIPDGTLNTPAKKADYVAFLKKQGWCDPLVGVPC